MIFIKILAKYICFCCIFVSSKLLKLVVMSTGLDSNAECKVTKSGSRALLSRGRGFRDKSGLSRD